MSRALEEEYGASVATVKEKHEGIPPLAHGANHIGSRRDGLVSGTRITRITRIQ
jgi:hypothetical protein